ncbi:MAG: hypothetical protein K0V04_18480 [Deltaproteobacteria bacterium]|nr:hypothetical protein [Deltaproteobacteria bacterium]
MSPRLTGEAFYEVWAVSNLDRDGPQKSLIDEHWLAARLHGSRATTIRLEP